MMNDDSLEQVERYLATLQPRDAPPALRAAVLTTARCELHAARWDRRLTRAATLLLTVGLVLNLALGLRPVNPRGGHSQSVTAARSQRLLVNTAVVIAEATDASTGIRVARQLAAMSGRELTSEEAAAIDAAVEQSGNHHSTNGNRG
jgi:hypothetical protein